MSGRRAAFLDRDGVINVDRGYVHTRADFEFIDGVFDAAVKLRDKGYALFVMTNQSGIGRGWYTEEQFLQLDTWMREQFAQRGAEDVDDLGGRAVRRKQPVMQYGFEAGQPRLVEGRHIGQ